MGLFDKKPKVDIEKVNLQIQNHKLQQEIQKTKFMNGIMESFKTTMQSFKSFPDEFYTTGIKQGKYAGLGSASNRTARELSRKAINISPVAEATVNTISTLSVGTGLKLESQPVWNLIPQISKWTDEQKNEWMKKSEARYRLWCKRKSTSYDESMNRYQMEQQEFYDLCIDGEYFHVYRYSTNSKLNPMTIQLVRPEDVRTPTGSTVAENNWQEDGIEYNDKGQAVAYHIYDYKTQKTVRVLKKGTRSGRTFVNHVKLGKNRRGTGIIANMIAELVKLGDYEMLELQAAVVNALYAVWVSTPEDGDPLPVLSGGIGSQAKASAEQLTVEDWQNNRKNINYSEGGLQLDMLPPGHKVESFDTKRPNVNFGAFMDQMKKNLYSSKNMPLSVMDKQFQNNYSASRGELILAWYEIEKYRFNQSFTDDTIYTMWLWGEIINNKIIAPGFLEDEEIREAWAGAKWIGNQRPDIDPLKSVKAHILEQDRAYKTGVQIAKERDGGDYEENLVRCKDELIKVAEIQKPLANNNMNGDDNLGDN